MVEKLIEKYKPYLILSLGEKYTPTSIEKYISMCDFYQNNKKIDLNFKDITDSSELDHGKNIKMFIKDEFKDIYKNNVSYFPPVYAYSNKKGNKLQIYYFFFYNYNGAKDVLGFYPIGEHKADLEWICLELEDKKPKYAFLSRHGYNKRYYYEDLQIIDNRMVIYSAINSHAHYPDIGNYTRFFGFGNDNCSQGKFINPILRYLKDNSYILKYKGKMDDKGKVDYIGRFKGKWIN
jgi:hypothetical protein